MILAIVNIDISDEGQGIARLTRSMVLNDLRSGLLVELNVAGLGSRRDRPQA